MNNPQVGRISQRLETCCNLLYPPLAPLFLRWQRNRRAPSRGRSLERILRSGTIVDMDSWTRMGSVWMGEEWGWRCVGFFFSLDIKGLSLKHFGGSRKNSPPKKKTGGDGWIYLEIFRTWPSIEIGKQKTIEFLIHNKNWCDSERLFEYV